jgi:hypothetical protein
MEDLKLKVEACRIPRPQNETFSTLRLRLTYVVRVLIE